MIRVLDSALGSRKYLVLLRVISVAVWFYAVVLWLVMEGGAARVSELPLPLRVFVDAAGAALAIIAIPGSVVLWISMIYYWRHFDAMVAWKRAIWFLVTFFGFCFGASIYYWFRVKRVVGATTHEDFHSRLLSALGLVKMLTLASLFVCGIVAFLAMPAHPLVPDYVLARIGFVAVPLTFIGSLVWIASAVFSKSNQVRR